jgi:hypothetical protein
MSAPDPAGDFGDIIRIYTALIADAANTSTRRQTVNNIYIGVNGLFLTAMGVLLISSHLDSWWVVVAAVAIALAVTPLNRSWLRTLKYYERLLTARYKTMREIEVHNQITERLFGTGNAMPSANRPSLAAQTANPTAGSPFHPAAGSSLTGQAAVPDAGSPLTGNIAFPVAGSPLTYGYIGASDANADKLSSSLATSTTLEMSLPRYFLWLYPAIAAGTAILVFLVSQHIMSAISL